MTYLDDGFHSEHAKRMVKFSAKMDPEVLEALREHAREDNRTLSWALTEAARQYLQRAQVRPAVRDAVEAVMDDNAELLQRLAR